MISSFRTTCESLPSNNIYKFKNGKYKYAPANEGIASRKFWLESQANSSKFCWVGHPEIAPIEIENDLLRFCIDASKPLVVVLLKEAEHGLAWWPQAPLIACLAGFIRHAAKKLDLGMGDKSFWTEKLMVVTPHHVQRQATRNAMTQSGIFPWDLDVEPTIATVEKSQGREYDAVIMDYCILEKHRIASELGFLYSRNRINVAMTRARSKCILFISDVMLQLNYLYWLFREDQRDSTGMEVQF